MDDFDEVPLIDSALQEYLGCPLCVFIMRGNPAGRCVTHLVPVKEEPEPREHKPGPGRPVGSKDKNLRLSASVKASVKAAFAGIPQDTYNAAAALGVSHPNARVRAVWFRIAADYLDGKPPDSLQIRDQRHDYDAAQGARDSLMKKVDRMFDAILRPKVEEGTSDAK